ncbi:MAG TPA: ankyrin repeat domain-containing protein, partial [Kiloniellales bacterium]|nr:ankyrin repeat domain-containing protein [Kiloniellales bacterium]
ALMWAAGHSNDVPARDALETIGVLLDRGASLDFQDNRGWSALMTAADMGHDAVVERLLEAGARADLTDRQGRSAQALARSAGHAETAALIDRKAAAGGG